MAEPAAAVPRESIEVALPVLSVVPEVADRVPALLVKLIATPDIAAPLPSVAVAVIVDVFEPSAGIDPELVTEIELSVPALPPGGLPVPFPVNESPPHPASNNVNADSAAIEKILPMFHPG
jgi:hypothetical protein